jgi:putative endonuclease
MEYVVYILYSKLRQQSYVGYTQNLINRFKTHNDYKKSKYTSKYDGWEVIHVEFYDSKQQALEREKYYKPKFLMLSALAKGLDLGYPPSGAIKKEK